MESIDKKEAAIIQLNFWAAQQASVDGMLGGFGSISDIDLHGSQFFLSWLMPRDPATPSREWRALDVGAGIGRVTKGLLVPHGFTSVDLVDSSARFLEEARGYVDSPAFGNTYITEMSSFDFERQSRLWDLIWIQWVAIYLTDSEFVDFFRKCGENMVISQKSFTVLKENVLRGDKASVSDKEDASVTRSDAHMKRLWDSAGLKVPYPPLF